MTDSDESTATTYDPQPDGKPDPGEVCWAWVPYEDDPSQGNDRPVLVIGVRDELLECLVMTSKDHDRDAEQEAREGRYWMDVGSGAWDPRGRPSEVRLNRLVILKAADVRREGAAVSREIYDAVLTARAAYL